MADKKVKIASDAEIDAALAKGRSEAFDTPVAQSVEYFAKPDVFVLNLKDGTRRVLQRENLQGLQTASLAQRRNVELLGQGTGLHWPDLNVDLYVPALVAGVYGSKEWMKEMARKGGMARTVIKAKAARENGKKGGRPKNFTISNSDRSRRTRSV